MVAAYLIDPARPRLPAATSSPSDEGIGAQIVDGARRRSRERAVLTRALAERQRARARGAGADAAVPRGRAAARGRAGGDGARGREARRGARCARSARRFGERADELERAIWELAGEEFTIGSPQQLGEILFEKLGLSRKRRGKTGFSTDARVLQAIRDEHEIVEKIEEWRELPKLKSTYLDALPGADRRRRPPAHHLQPDRHHHRPAVEHQPEPAEHPDPHRAGPRDPRLLRRRARAAS